jgi:elongation factor Ts
MAKISAATVMKLRKMSGQGMMDCKKALAEANGNIEEALTILRKKGLATLQKRAGRETSEGSVLCKTDTDGRTAILATLCCETDFVANSDDFKAAAAALGDYALACPAQEGVENVLEATINGKKFSEVLTETVSKIGEKIQVQDYAKFSLAGPGFIGTYVHFNSKVGTMVEVQTGDEKQAAAQELKQAANDIAMHITAVKPLAMDKDSVDAATIERERAIAAEQVKNKPAHIIDKIVDGKMNKFYRENCLLEQGFVKDNSKSVSQVLAEAAKKSGGEAKVKRFVRFEIG